MKGEEEARRSGDRVADIRPNNVFKTEDGTIKISSLASWPQATTSFQRAILHLPAYVSPEDMGNLAKGNNPSTDV